MSNRKGSISQGSIAEVPKVKEVLGNRGYRVEGRESLGKDNREGYQKEG